MSQSYTVAQVAKILKVSPKTVIAWFDSGDLSGYKIPGTQARYISKESLIQLMKSYKGE